jgi:hypothetical protein
VAEQTLYCTFCGKSHHEVAKLVVANGGQANICNECIRICSEMFSYIPSVWLREVDSGTPNASWVVCNKVDPGAVEFRAVI